MQTVERTTLLRAIEAGILFVGLPIVATHPKVRVPPVAALTVLAAYIAYLLAVALYQKQKPLSSGFCFIINVILPFFLQWWCLLWVLPPRVFQWR